jgi:hypothetical protein
MKLDKEKDEKELMDQEEETVLIKRGKKRNKTKKESYEKKSGKII